jgi:hypothetical protein
MKSNEDALAAAGFVKQRGTTSDCAYEQKGRAMDSFEELKSNPEKVQAGQELKTPAG